MTNAIFAPSWGSLPGVANFKGVSFLSVDEVAVATHGDLSAFAFAVPTSFLFASAPLVRGLWANPRFKPKIPIPPVHPGVIRDRQRREEESRKKVGVPLYAPQSVPPGYEAPQRRPSDEGGGSKRGSTTIDFEIGNGERKVD